MAAEVPTKIAATALGIGLGISLGNIIVEKFKEKKVKPMEKKIFPLVDRETPVMDWLRGRKMFKEVIKPEITPGVDYPIMTLELFDPEVITFSELFARREKLQSRYPENDVYIDFERSAIVMEMR